MSSSSGGVYYLLTLACCPLQSLKYNRITMLMYKCKTGTDFFSHHLGQAIICNWDTLMDDLHHVEYAQI